MANGGEKTKIKELSQEDLKRCTQCGQVLLSSEPGHLDEGRFIIGQLSDIVEPDGEDYLLARIAGKMMELPKSLSASLWALMGRKVVAGLILGQYKVGLSTQ
jgi:hypothetical protein